MSTPTRTPTPPRWSTLLVDCWGIANSAPTAPATPLFITHDQEEALEIGDRVLIEGTGA